LLSLAWSGAGATDRENGKKEPSQELQVDFDAAARLALRQSPSLVRSTLEIDIKRMDESDSRFDLFFPSMTVNTRYYINKPQETSTQPFTLDFSSVGYNPAVSYFSLQARKLVTQIAILAHMKVIGENLHRLGQSFLELAATNQMAVLQEEMLALAQKQLAYAQKRQDLGEGTALEMEAALKEVEVAMAERERLRVAEKTLQARIKLFLGIPIHQNFHVDLKSARQQVVGAFDVARASLEEALVRSFDLKIQSLTRELQKYQILLAKAQLLPTFTGGVQTPDPLSVVNARGLFVFLGFSYPIWDGFKRVRDISRNKAVLKQIEADQKLKEIDFSQKWGEAQERLRAAGEAAKLSQLHEKMTELRARQSDILYRERGEPLTLQIEGRRGYVESQKNVAASDLQYDLAQLGLRALSGDLVYRYVDESSWQK